MRIEIFRVGGSVEICDEENQDHVVMKVVECLYSTTPVKVINDNNEAVEIFPYFAANNDRCVEVVRAFHETEYYNLNGRIESGIRSILNVLTPWHVTETIDDEAGQEVTNDFATFEYARYYASTCYGETRIWHDDDLEEE